MSFEDNTWHKWISRATAMVRERLGAGVWERVFRHLFDYAPGPGRSN
jgi:hypothetical protein